MMTEEQYAAVGVKSQANRDRAEIAYRLGFAAGKAEGRPGAQWVSVKERLPVVELEQWSDPVLCLFDSGAICVESCMRYTKRETSWNLAPGVTAKVTHWMPLPKPPAAIEAAKDA